MIEAMSKITLLLHTNSKKRNLAKLQQLGLVHIDSNEIKTGIKLSSLLRKKKRFEAILGKISKLKQPKKENSKFPKDISTAHQQLYFLEKKLTAYEEKILALEEMLDLSVVLEPWGDLDWDRIDSLKSKGISIRFFITTKIIWESTSSDETILIPVNFVDEKVYLLALDFKNTPKEFSFEEVHLTQTSRVQLKKEIQIIRQSIVEDEVFLSGFYSQIINLSSEIRSIENQIDFENAKINLANSMNGILFAITGWVPTKNKRSMIEFLELNQISYLFQENEKKDEIPILLKNTKLVRFFEPITRIFSLPNYIELDPTFFFAPFFTLFFGLSLGDVGYGLILSLASIIAYIKVSSNLKPYAILGLILSLSATFCGVLVNSMFGEPLFQVPESDFYFLKSGSDLAIFTSFDMNGKTIYPTMTLALLLGFIQLSLGLVLQSFNRTVAGGSILFSIKPISILMILWGGMIVSVHADFLALGFNSSFQIGILKIGGWASQIPKVYGTGTFLLGLLFFLLFHDPTKNIFLRPIFGIWEAYQLTTGFLGDFLSYIRLFALGLAGGLLGNAFNKVAFMILPNGDIHSPLFAITIVILIVGHSLNLGLGILGSFVHPLRLTFVEFYKSINFTGGGKEFKPFALQK
jgi:V/A-type H+-transporting ATPase subunit I